MEGTLQKKTRGGKWHERQFTVDEDSLCWLKSDNKTQVTVNLSPDSQNTTIEVRDIKFGFKKYAFEVTLTGDQNRVIGLAAASDTEKKQWMNAIESAAGLPLSGELPPKGNRESLQGARKKGGLKQRKSVFEKRPPKVLDEQELQGSKKAKGNNKQASSRRLLSTADKQASSKRGLSVAEKAKEDPTVATEPTPAIGLHQLLGIGAAPGKPNDNSVESIAQKRLREKLAGKVVIPVFKQNKCGVCEKTVYKMEEILVDNKPYHKSCFRCAHCKRQLTLSNFAAVNKQLYCKTHYIELFKEAGGRYEVFGDSGFKRKSMAPGAMRNFAKNGKNDKAKDDKSKEPKAKDDKSKAKDDKSKVKDDKSKAKDDKSKAKDAKSKPSSKIITTHAEANETPEPMPVSPSAIARQQREERKSRKEKKEAEDRANAKESSEKKSTKEETTSKARRSSSNASTKKSKNDRSSSVASKASRSSSTSSSRRRSSGSAAKRSSARSERRSSAKSQASTTSSKAEDSDTATESSAESDSANTAEDSDDAATVTEEEVEQEEQESKQDDGSVTEGTDNDDDTDDDDEEEDVVDATEQKQPQPEARVETKNLMSELASSNHITQKLASKNDDDDDNDESESDDNPAETEQKKDHRISHMTMDRPRKPQRTRKPKQVQNVGKVLTDLKKETHSRSFSIAFNSTDVLHCHASSLAEKNRWTTIVANAIEVLRLQERLVDAQKRDMMKSLQAQMTLEAFQRDNEVEYQGFLEKQAMKSKKNWKKRYCVLKGNVLEYFVNDKAKKPKNSLKLTAKSKVLDSEGVEIEAEVPETEDISALIPGM